MADRISNVSATAHWVAVYRAWESARPDRLFSDPLAARLAGAQGQSIAGLAPRNMRSGWPMIVRTKLMDDLVSASLREGCDCVVNLAAGLDTRPYRLPLPASLNWIEADLPAIIEEKNRLLESETPVCRLRREKVDLTDTIQRREFLDRVEREANRALIITEGLLIYLDSEAVDSLGRDFAARAPFRWWILEIASPAILRMMQRGMGDQLAQAPLKFAPPDGVAFFERLGWKALEIQSIVREAVRLRRAPLFLRLFSMFPQPDPRNLGRWDRWSGVVRFERAQFSAGKDLNS
jgi:methyltransferase (TIGR00027 family)